ncbi:MAG: type I-B CRISPR-associated protein Cas8b/Csh1 [Syntrophomonadaceae bacterium]|nr:type I-B CRISPR-associated protein Cas8b/Csh1 [Syntrophomonadaceae bacterium]
MLADVIEIFAKELEEHGEKLILDSYIPADGEYVIVSLEDFTIIDRVEIKQDKKTKEIDRNNPNFDFLCYVDYVSKYLNSDKALASKNIHSNNYLTFFVKKENVHNEEKINDKIIAEYYEILKDPSAKSKYRERKTKEIIENIEKEIGQPNEIEINRIESWIKNNLYELVDKDSRDKSYLKIFFKCDLDTYKNESNRYILPNIYNSNDHNEIVNENIYGFPNNNMGLNSKKPFLENKTRKKTVPSLISQDGILKQKMFFDHLFNLASAGRYNVYASETSVIGLTNDNLPNQDFTGYFLRIRKGKKEAEIIDFDIIGLYKVAIRPFRLRNVLDLEKTEVRYRTIHKLVELKEEINKTLFYNFLTNNYFTEAKDLSINDSILKRNILLARAALFRWFYKGNSEGVWQVLDTGSLDLIKAGINNAHLLKASEQFNLRSSLKHYFEGGEDMADILVEVKNSLREKINLRDTDYFTSEEEYFFAVGQVTYYLLSLSKASKKTHALANPVFNAKSDEQIKEILKRLFIKYNHEEKMGRRFAHLYAMVSGYVPEDKKINDDLIIAGYLHSNLIYEKSIEEVADNE